MAESLIDEMTLTRIPVLIGAGIPLFGPLRQDMGFVQSIYRAIKHDSSCQPN